MKLKSNKRNIWFTSDTHYGHSNICYSTSVWENKESTTRKFPSIDKMNDTIVNNINTLIMPDDILFHLGDWSMGGYNNIWKFRDRLNVKEIHLIAGNHDEHIKSNKQFIDRNCEANDLFTSISDYMELRVDGKNIILCHYPIVSWNHKHKDAWHLHGHTHNNLFKDETPQYWYNVSKILDVGLDTTYEMFNQYIPFSFKQIKTFMNNRQFIELDHHNKDTQ